MRTGVISMHAVHGSMLGLVFIVAPVLQPGCLFKDGRMTCQPVLIASLQACLPCADGAARWQSAGVPPQPANFSSYLNGEPVRGADLVNWVTVGAFDIPTSESAPVTSVSGRRLSFWLLPYNYFDQVRSRSLHSPATCPAARPGMHARMHAMRF